MAREHGECALCREVDDLCHSHIVPEFLYTPIYGTNPRRTNQFSRGDARPQFLQKGPQEYLLCEQCEGRCQVFESSFARYWYKNSLFPDPPLPRELSLENVDYENFKLLLLSVIWRASVAKTQPFKSVRLGPHEERIRQMLLAGDPGPSGMYPVFGGLIVDPSSRELWDNIVLLPLRLRVGGLWAYRLVFAGASWTVLVSRHHTLGIEPYFLTEDGTLRLKTIGWPDFARETGLPETVRSLLPPAAI